jgi:hypothetical protein
MYTYYSELFLLLLRRLAATHLETKTWDSGMYSNSVRTVKMGLADRR